MITLPLHYGSTGQSWPGGHYWIVESKTQFGDRLFWTDNMDFAGRTGWAHSPQYGAGFASHFEAMVAFQQRGVRLHENDEITIQGHIWADDNPDTKTSYYLR